MNVKKTILIPLLFVLVGGIIIAFLSRESYESRVTLGGKTFVVDVADNSITQARGLSGRDSLGSNQGMFFVFKDMARHGFWMNKMNFPIDIIWMDQNYVVNYIEKKVSPDTYPKIFDPEILSMYVLEISSGQSDMLGIKIGDQAKFIYKNRI